MVIYLRNVEFHELAGDLRELDSALYIANSEFTARTYKEKFGIDSTVIPPTIDPVLYGTPTTGEYVTFINPYNEKGFELAVQIAGQCPDIPFLFVESWKLADDHRASIEKTIAPLKNIKLENRTSDMKTVYGRTKILLAPSKWEEAWGRVASEAHCSGIPVVGSAVADCRKRLARVALFWITTRRWKIGSARSAGFGLTRANMTGSRPLQRNFRSGRRWIRKASFRRFSAFLTKLPARISNRWRDKRRPIF